MSEESLMTMHKKFSGRMPYKLYSSIYLNFMIFTWGHTPIELQSYRLKGWKIHKAVHTFLEFHPGSRRKEMILFWLHGNTTHMESWQGGSCYKCLGSSLISHLLVNRVSSVMWLMGHVSIHNLSHVFTYRKGVSITLHGLWMCSESSPLISAHLVCPFALEPTHSTEGASLKFYTPQRLMNMRKTGGRGDEGGTEMDERRRGGKGQRGTRQWGMWDV